MIVKHVEGLSDEKTIQKNPHMQYKDCHVDCYNHPLGRPPKDENDCHAEDKKRAIGERNEVEATFGTSKRVYRANDIRAKLSPDTTQILIIINGYSGENGVENAIKLTTDLLTRYAYACDIETDYVRAY